VVLLGRETDGLAATDGRIDSASTEVTRIIEHT